MGLDAHGPLEAIWDTTFVVWCDNSSYGVVICLRQFRMESKEFV